MLNLNQKLLIAFENHCIKDIKNVLQEGLNLNTLINNKKPINLLIEMYTRSDAFADCIHFMIENGAILDDPLIEPVLLNDSTLLLKDINKNKNLITHRTNIESAFTPLLDATLLHIAAEYGHLNVARTLIENGAELDAKAGIDKDGLNGQSPLFHTVNSNANRSAPVMDLLLEAGANSNLFLNGLTWGKGFEWETVLFDLTPISYAQFGLLPQMHRDQKHIYQNITSLLKHSNRTKPEFNNIPNKYLKN